MKLAVIHMAACILDPTTTLIYFAGLPMVRSSLSDTVERLASIISFEDD